VDFDYFGQSKLVGFSTVDNNCNTNKPKVFDRISVPTAWVAQILSAAGNSTVAPLKRKKSCMAEWVSK
jgi:hypothetical protein